jgi:hypothetical protein
MTYSEDQGNNTTWSAFGTSVTRTTGQTDPGNNSTANKLVFDATTADAVISRSVTVLNATQYTISMWMRADSGTVTNVRFARAAGSAGAIFPTLTTAWQRVQLTFTSSTTSDGIEIRVLNAGSPKTATVHLWGAQLETGSGASSYIPTVASTGNRAEDTCYMDGTNFSSWYSASTQTGTLFADITHSALSNANGGIELGNGLGSQTSANRVSLRRDGVIVDGVSSITVSPTGASQRFKTAIAFAPGTGNTAACRNGGTVSNPAQAAGTLSGINALKFYIDASPALRPYGWIRQVKVWPTNLANTTIQVITTI